MPVLWSFRCYVDPSGTDEIRAWHDEQSSKRVRAKFWSRLRTLAQLPFQEWEGSLHKSLQGDGAGLGEIRFESDNIQFRPLGFRSGTNEYTMLIVAIEKGGKFVPASAIEKAQKRKIEVKANKDRTNALWLPLE